MYIGLNSIIVRTATLLLQIEKDRKELITYASIGLYYLKD